MSKRIKKVGGASSGGAGSGRAAQGGAGSANNPTNKEGDNSQTTTIP